MTTKTFLFQEIHEQPEILEQFLNYERGTIVQLVKAIRQRSINHVVIAARGTSDNAGRYAKYLFGAVNKLPVSLATPSLFTIYNQPPNLKNALVLGISQSGKSPDIVSVLAEARRQGALTAIITNQSDSDLAQQAEHVIRLHAGVERSVAATKTYTSELMAIALLGATLAEDDQMMASLKLVPEAIRAALSINHEVSQIAQRYCYMRYCVVIGRGYNYATAFELALKLKELTYTIAEPYSSADFLHGPVALIEQGFPAIVIAPSGRMMTEMERFIHVLNERGAEVIIVSDDVDIMDQSRISLSLPLSLPEWLSPMTAIVPGQLFSLHLALARGYAPDIPRGLRKVTETR